MKKEELIQTLETLRKYRLCVYLGGSCDCKFGFEKRVKSEYDEMGKMIAAHQHIGEHTGCPEMRVIISILKEIPQHVFTEALAAIERKEYEKMSKRK